MKAQILLSRNAGAEHYVMPIVQALGTFENIDITYSWEHEHRAVRLTIATADGSDARRDAFGALVTAVLSWVTQRPVNHLSAVEDETWGEVADFTDAIPPSFAVMEEVA